MPHGTIKIRVNLRSELRVTPFTPRFEWVSTIAAVADAINRPHEDYPQRVAATEREVERLSRVRLARTISAELTLSVHRAVFAYDLDILARKAR